MFKNKKKRASLLQEVLIHLILIGLVFALFFFATAGRINSKQVKQQVIEKELALLIDSAMPGMSFSVTRANRNGVISNIEIKDGKIFAYLEGQTFSKGYDFFSKYNVYVEKDENKFYVMVG